MNINYLITNIKQDNLNLKYLSFIAIVILLTGCKNSASLYPDFEVGEFGAFYTCIHSTEEFEKHSRVREHPDIVVDIGKGSMTFNFWRGASYLPYLESSHGRWYVEDLTGRKGDGSGLMTDRNNTFSHVKIVSSSESEVIVHWRYLPIFEGNNPKSGAAPDKFVDEYYIINSKGEVKRSVQKGTERIDEWNNQENLMVQTFKLSRTGFKEVELKVTENKREVAPVKGNPVIVPPLAPLLWWKFDEGENDLAAENFTKTTSEVAGHKTLWRKGISGTSLQFDGYFSEIRFPTAKAPALSDAITLEGWVALGAYPWNEVPMIQQLDDVPEELIGTAGKRGTMEFHFVTKEENDKGYFLGIDGLGMPLFKLNIGGKLQSLKADTVLERRTWYHLAATYDKIPGLMEIFVNGKRAGQKYAGKTGIVQSENDIRIGKGKDRRPIRPVRQNSFPDSYSLDGLTDEIKVYGIRLSEEEVEASYNSYMGNSQYFSQPDMDKRLLPGGEERKKFGAYYTRLKFYDTWDNLWRFGKHPDVVVEFDNHPAKFIFWRGAGYIPMMVNETGQWYSNEFNETWSTSGGIGCQEPMSDKESYTNHVRILENTPARTVIHWRYPLVDVNHVVANYNDTTGWGDWSDWYYYIYPDGVAVKSMKLWTHGVRNHEWQESMAIFGPDQHPEEIINTREAITMMNLKGEIARYDWIGGPPDNVKEPEGQAIQIVNYTGKLKPVTIGKFFRSNVYGGELTPYSVFPTWNHWPVGQMPSDGRYAIYPDRTAHSSLTHLFPVVYKEEPGGNTPYYEKLLMEAMSDKTEEDLLLLAKSWLNAPQPVNLKGAEGEYAPDQGAYVLTRKERDVSFSIEASNESPLVNLAVVIKKWGSNREAQVLVNGGSVQSRQGIFRDTDGTKTLTLWIEVNEQKRIDIKIK
jgi:hypothetical protein